MFWTVLSLSVPLLLVNIFMTPNQEIVEAAPAIIGSYGLSFIFLPFNIFSTYYFQALMKPKAAFLISVARGLVISGLLIFLLPLTLGADMLWFVMPITELITALFAGILMKRYTGKLPLNPQSKKRKELYTFF